MRRVIQKIFAFPFILLVRLYQRIISPLTPQSCRHVPTCSNYTIEAIEEWGVLKGIWLGAVRLSKCHPWGSWGYDPVPKKCDNSDHKQAQNKR